MSTIIKTVTDLIEPIIEQEQLELVDVTYSKEGGRFFLRVFIDKPKGISIDDCERVSVLVSTLLDQHDPIPQSYVLEISSPGLDRPLKHRRDCERFRGKKVKISMYAPVKGRRRLTGVLLGFKDGHMRLKLENEDTVSVPWEAIAQARLVAEIDWEGIK
ncbi:MAG TPA: ribosome maturation factor RimP [bacterium]|nr:ribosome maturation factor RimP [bacterium]